MIADLGLRNTDLKDKNRSEIFIFIRNPHSPIRNT
jgi:hypothetical protein